MAVMLALGASLAWGTSDLLGGIATRTRPLPVVLAGSQLAGLLALAPLLLLHGTSIPDDGRLWLGAGAGVLAVGELGLIYVAISRGPVVVMAPIAALGAMVPAVIGVAQGERLDLLISTGMACALGGAAAASWTAAEERRPGRQAIIGAAVAGGAALGAGAVLTLVDLSSQADPWWTVAAVRTAGALTALGSLAAALVWGSVRGRTAKPGSPRLTSAKPGSARLWRSSVHSFGPAGWRLLARAGLLTVIATGLTDACADVAFANAARHGALAIVAVLASLYPVATILLGVTLLSERPNRVQSAGAALAFAGVAILGATT